MKVGILGAGNIARKMARTLKALEAGGDPSLAEACYAVASRDLVKAQAFAAEYGVSKAYGSYEELVSDDEIDLIYVATPHSMHHSQVRLALEHGRNVLCEKAFMMSAAEARDVIALAEEKGLLLAEAAWPRYMPSSAKVRQLIDSGAIGRVHSLFATMGYAEMGVRRVNEPALGGGALLDIGVYPLHFAMLCYGPELKIVSSHATITGSGVDSQDFILLEDHQGRVAQLHASAIANSEQRGIINGDEGCIIVDSISHPSLISVYDGHHHIVEEHSIPPMINGFEYQVLACKEAIDNGWTECPSLPHSDMLRIMELTDALLADWGVVLG